MFGLPYDVKPMWADLTDAGMAIGKNCLMA